MSELPEGGHESIGQSGYEAESLFAQWTIEQKYQDDLHTLRATVNGELLNRGVMTRGHARAIFYHQQEHRYGPPTNVFTLVFVRPAKDADQGDYFRPNIRIVVNEALPQVRKDVLLVKDFTADENNRAQYMIDLYNSSEPEYPAIEQTNFPKINTDPWLPRFGHDGKSILLTTNFRKTTPIGSIKTKNETVYPFGKKDDLHDMAQSLEQGIELAQPLANARLYFVEEIN